MKRYIAYLKYVIRHKKYVYIAGRKLKLPIWRLLVHDWDKFTPKMFIAYAKSFYKPDGSSQYCPTKEFNETWNRHQKINAHHWQYWLLTLDKGTEVPLRMHEVDVREMVADWIGAGLAITGKVDVMNWYEKNRHNIKIDGDTRSYVELLLVYATYIFTGNIVENRIVGLWFEDMNEKDFLDLNKDVYNEYK